MAYVSSTRKALATVPSDDNVDSLHSVLDRHKKSYGFDHSRSERIETSESFVSIENLLESPPAQRTPDRNTVGNSWEAGLLRRFPYSGVFALLTVILCAVGNAIILCKSDGKEVGTWIVSPSVLLAISSATANVCLAYAHRQGVIIAWWRKALHGGTLNDLNHYWESGDSLLAAVTSGRSFNIAAFATLVAAVIVVDVPLLQKASTPVTREITRPVNVTALIAKELPYGYTGYGADRAISDQSLGRVIMTQPFAEVANSYATRAPITTNFTGCLGTCRGSVRASGLAVNCSESSTIWTTDDVVLLGDEGVKSFSSMFHWLPSQDMGAIVTYMNGTNPSPQYPFIDYQLQYARGRNATSSNMLDEGLWAASNVVTGCTGTLVTKRCSMRSATLDYPTIMKNKTITLSRGSFDFPVDHIQEAGITPPNWRYADRQPGSYMTLGGVVKLAQNLFGSNAEQAGAGRIISINGSLPNQYLDYGSGNKSFFKTQDACAINFRDPTNDIVDALNEVMFRASLSASTTSKYSIINASVFRTWTSYYEMFPVNYTSVQSGMPVAQIIPMMQDTMISVYESHYWFLAGALVVMILGVLVVIPLFVSYWELGRDVSLNPLEIAKAFNADMLRDQGSNSTLEHLTNKFGEIDVRYGEVIEELETSRLRVRKYGAKRLEMANPSRVRTPPFREVYA